MRIISLSTLSNFWKSGYADAEQSLKSWFKETKNAEWISPNIIKKNYPSASILNNNRVVFNIKGNNYRLIVSINYDYAIVYIRFIGTHAQYDKIDANTI